MVSERILRGEEEDHIYKQKYFIHVDVLLLYSKNRKWTRYKYMKDVLYNYKYF